MTTTSWPEPVERVAAYMRAAGAEARLEELRRGTRTAAEAAEAVGCALAQVVKSVVVLCDGRPVVALVPGDRRADLEKIRRAVGAATARVAGPDEVESTTGFTPGAVAPFAHGVERVVVERTLLAHPVVWAGGGSSRHLVALAPGELARLARAEPMDAIEEPAYHSQPDTDRKER
jgi:prolyl-tRNA editing enzyme YbaK/EbsC (Cys-tRNA(Pro) deacylase)